jgi:hypothetical protein
MSITANTLKWPGGFGVVFLKSTLMLTSACRSLGRTW